MGKRKDVTGRHRPNFRIFAATALLLAFVFHVPCRAQELDLPDSSSPAPKTSLPSALKSEIQRYWSDGDAILLAPLHWDGSSWTQAGIAAASILAITQEDSHLESVFQEHRSSQTNAFSSAVRPLGTYAGIGISVFALGGGFLFKDSDLRDTGRDAIEAEIFAAGIVTPILKRTFGRLRPSQGSDADEFQSLSSDQSFPSGESTEAFALASVFAARSQGWVVPTVAYALASGVALARMNDRAHFASDVVTGALIGTAIGRAVVHRHTGDQERPISWNFVPVFSSRGAGLGVQLDIGAR